MSAVTRGGVLGLLTAAVLSVWLSIGPAYAEQQTFDDADSADLQGNGRGDT